MERVLDFYTAAFDNIRILVDKERFIEADEIIFGDIETSLTEYNINK